MKNQDWEIPPNLQPDPDDYSFDLERALKAMVNLKTYVPPDAFTAGTLGTERAGSGVVIRESGLVATIGYLITEAETIWITSADGRAIPGHALAYDQESGFGLVQALGRLDLPALEMGDSDRLKVGDQVVFAAGGGRHHAVETRVVGRQEFAGYWEYVLDDAIFTAPAHPFWGGGGLIGSDGKLMGIGSLILQQGDGKGRRLDMNMVVPIGLLTPIMKDLMSYGRVNRPARPWLGMYATESDDTIVVGGVADNGPAEQAGVRAGDHDPCGGRRRDHRSCRAVAACLGIGQRRGRGAAAADARQEPGGADRAVPRPHELPEVAEAALNAGGRGPLYVESVRPQSFLQQLTERRSRVRLPFRWNVPGQRVGRALHQNAQNRVGVRLACADHADHFGEDVRGIGPVGGYALDPPDQCVDGWIGSVGHGLRMAGRAGMRQECV